MKYLLTMLLLSLTLLANTLSLDFKKETNGNYMMSIPSLKIKYKEKDFINEIKLDLKFTAPRSDYSSLNHYGVAFSNSSGIEINGYFITFSLDINYIFEGNSYNLEDGFNFGNTLSIGYNF